MYEITFNASLIPLAGLIIFGFGVFLGFGARGEIDRHKQGKK